MMSRSCETHSELLEQRPSDDCGCPEEDWVINGVHVTIHLEPDGTGHAFFDAGDWDTEELFDCRGIEALRNRVCEWVAALPEER